MMEYIIIEVGSGYCQQLAARVNESIARGWVPLGAPFVIPTAHSILRDGAYHRIDTTICQAMIRQEAGSNG